VPLTRPGRSAFVAAACVVGAAACDARPPAPDARRDPRHDAALADTLVGTVVAAYDFSRPGVPERLAGLYPADGPVVSAAGGGVTTSRAALRAEIERFWARVGRNMREPRFVVGERHVTPLGPDAAALTFTYAIPHRTPEGRPHTLAGAWTAVFRRDGGRWVIVQEHLSDAPPAGAPGVAGDTARAAAGPGGAPHAGH
jgi:ketosteroid isomerase-like protein